jgi:hypothetical protein
VTRGAGRGTLGLPPAMVIDFVRIDRRHGVDERPQHVLAHLAFGPRRRDLPHQPVQADAAASLSNLSGPSLPSAARTILRMFGADVI